MENRLAELVFKDHANLHERLKIIASTIEEFVTGLPHDEPMRLAGDTRKAIDRCFCFNDINSICAALEAENSDWGRETLATLLEHSPTSLKVTVRQMKLGESWSIDMAFQREAEIAAHFMEHHDFVEGVTAKLLHKPPIPAQWQPATLDEVKSEDVEAYFRIPEGKQKLPLIIEGAEYMRYPHGWIGLPIEEDVRKVVEQNQMSQKQVVNHFIQKREGQVGVKEKVEEIVARMTEERDATATWIAVKRM